MNSELNWEQITFENARSLSKLTVLVEQTSKDVSRLAKHEAKIDRLITQNGEIKDAIGEIKDRIDEDKKKLRLAYFIADYPRASLALLVSAWALTFYEVRAAIGVQLEPVINFIKLIKGLL